jgi:choline dehydrogenase-like flavoprotein
VSAQRVAIVGSGMMGSNMALTLARAGFEVTVFEKGPDYPYPQQPAFERNIVYDWPNPAWSLPPDLARMVNTGSYARVLWPELVLRVGGSGTAWTGLATRMAPVDFRLHSERGYALDWPVGYDTLEPWMCAAESRLGVSGTDDDNPWAPPRSRPYPLPPFGLTADDVWFSGKLAAAGIHMHTTPQARTSRNWDDRPACMNIGECAVCPIGARYSPTHHLQQAIATGRCRLVTDTTVRRVLTDASGRARGVVARGNAESADREHAADVVIVVSAAFESARLLLLSKDARHPDGLGNTGGHVGRHLTFHHIWNGHMHYRQRVGAGAVGFWTGQSDQFTDPPRRGEVGGIKLELPSLPLLTHQHDAGEATTMAEALRLFELTARCRQVGLHAETVPSDRKYVALAAETDRFGDPVAHVHYDSSDFDRRTHEFGRELFERVAKSTGAVDWQYPALEEFGTYAHHMGTCRMGTSSADSVTDSFGAVHDTPGLYVIGLSNFVGSGGAVNPTLTGVALALRAADFLIERKRV